MMQFEPVLIVRRLVVLKGAKSVYDEKLHPGVNVIRGENSSGKSTVLNFIYYGLGGDLTEWSEAALLCSKVYLEVELNGLVVTLARDVADSANMPMDVFNGSYDISLAQPASSWKRYPYRRSLTTESFSQVIFRLLNIPEVATDVSGNVTMHQILRLLYADQLSPVDEIFRFERFEQKNIRDTVGRLLCGAYTSNLYDNEQSLRKMRKEFDRIDAQLRNLFIVLGRAEQELVSADWLQAEYQELYRRKGELEQQIEALERKQLTMAREEISLKAQEHAYNLVQKSQIKLSSLKQMRDSLLLDIADSTEFINGLKEKIENLRDSAVVAQTVGDVQFHSCPACYSILDSEEEALDYVCHLCKTPYSSEQVTGRIAGLINEAAVQVKQSELLQDRRKARLEEFNKEIDDAQREWASSARELSTSQRLPSTESQQQLRELQKELGYVERMIEDLEQKSKMANVVADLSRQKVELEAQMASVEAENERLRNAQQNRLNAAYVSISEEVKDLLHQDLRRQDSFEFAQHLDFSFESNRLTVDGQSYFSASSRAILKSSFFIGFTSAAGKVEYFRHPRFCMIDTLENMGVEAVRSQNFQRLIVKKSSALNVKHQIIYATAMIDPELNDVAYTVGRYSTRDEPTIELWR